MIYSFPKIVKTLVWGTEEWVLSGVKGSESITPDGKTLNDIYGGEFPLLIKFIDAKRDLSIQVHPDDALAAARHGCKGKTEMWYIIGASEGAHLLAGLSKEIGPDDYVRLVDEDRITEVIADHMVAPGDVFFLPAGRIHAICGGYYLAEIQETSDITYRIYDYNRPGLDGKPRQLHTQQAKVAIDYKVYPDYRTPYTPAKDKEVTLVRDSHFTTSLCDIQKPLVLRLAAAEGSASASLPPRYRPAQKTSAEADPLQRPFLILIGLEGEAEVAGGTSQSSPTVLRAGEALLVLDETELKVNPSTPSARFLSVRP